LEEPRPGTGIKYRKDRLVKNIYKKESIKKTK